MASVCTGAFLVARTGAVGDRPVTTHHEDVPALKEILGDQVEVARWVDAGALVTSGGLSSGVAMALHLVERATSREFAVATARQLAYDWDPEEGMTEAGR